MSVYFSSLAQVATATATLAVELTLILAEAACEYFLDVRRGPGAVTVLDWVADE